MPWWYEVPWWGWVLAGFGLAAMSRWLMLDP
jgi:hypothetical protein